MIARVFIHTPFKILITAGENYLPISIESEGYKIFYYPPFSDPDYFAACESTPIKLNGKDAVLCNVVWIDFQKGEFDRTIDPQKNNRIDPPLITINKFLNDFLIRLRHLTNAHRIHPIDLSSCRWRIVYLKDDGTEFPKEDGKFRVTAQYKSDVNYAPLGLNIWNDLFATPLDFGSQYWSDLFLDGKDKFPEIGPSIVLTSTALEVFISQILDHLAKNGKISPDLWQWINNRPNWLQQPSVEEQYDILLKLFTNHTLKEDVTLWSAFKKLRTARNTFVHEGIARVNKKSSEELGINQARELILLANKIPLKIREWLPEDIQWKISTNDNTVSGTIWPPHKGPKKMIVTKFEYNQL
jgi:hypothetical protein